MKNKKGDMPYWMVMLISLLLGLVVILGIIAIEKNKLFGLLEWLG